MGSSKGLGCAATGKAAPPPLPPPCNSGCGWGSGRYHLVCKEGLAASRCGKRCALPCRATSPCNPWPAVQYARDCRRSLTKQVTSLPAAVRLQYSDTIAAAAAAAGCPMHYSGVCERVHRGRQRAAAHPDTPVWRESGQLEGKGPPGAAAEGLDPAPLLLWVRRGRGGDGDFLAHTHFMSFGCPCCCCSAVCNHSSVSPLLTQQSLAGSDHIAHRHRTCRSTSRDNLRRLGGSRLEELFQQLAPIHVATQYIPDTQVRYVACMRPDPFVPACSMCASTYTLFWVAHQPTLGCKFAAAHMREAWAIDEHQL